MGLDYGNSFTLLAQNLIGDFDLKINLPQQVHRLD